MKNCLIENNKENSIALNRLAREQMKLRLLADIRTDIEVSRIEGFDYKEYLLELKDIIDGFLRIKEAGGKKNENRNTNI